MEDLDMQRIYQPGNKEALALWHKVILHNVRKDSFDLSARQMALLMTVYTVMGPHTVRGLSEYLNVSKPAICRALDTLSKYELVERKVDEKDRRNVHIIPTERGFEFLGNFSEDIMQFLLEM